MRATALSKSWVRFGVAPAVAVALALAAGCSSTNKADETLNWGPDKLYAEAKSDLADGRWSSAVKLLERLESRYPFGRYAEQAQIDQAYAYYKDNDPAQALAACDRFIKLHPNHARVDYVLYLKGLVNFNDGSGLLSRIGGQDLTERDPKAARESFDSFRELVTRFPESEYAPDARARMTYLLNALAAGELHVARYYFRRGAYLAAINRAQTIVKQYQETPSAEEALAILVYGYKELKLADLQADATRVLQTNYPQSPYLASYRADGRKAEKVWWKVW